MAPTDADVQRPLPAVGMPAMNAMVGLSVRGEWPGELVIRSGWSKAQVRPANDDLPEAVLRLERGSSAFLRRCVRHLLELGAPAVLSPPIPARSRRVWEEAGFRPHRQLLLMERDLSSPIPEPGTPVRAGRGSEWELAAQIDRAAFPPDWRLGRVGLADAAASTPRSRFLVADHDGEVAGFAVVGVSQQVGYLQRIAVRPETEGRGLGRSLVRASMQWAARRSARSMLLNTQPDNAGAIGLYHSEGFAELPDGLFLLRADSHHEP